MARTGIRQTNNTAKMNTDILRSKEALRKQQYAANKSISSAERTAAAELIRARFKDLEVWHNSRSILFYAPLPDEPDIWPLLADAEAAGKAIMLPRYSANDHAYFAGQVVNLNKDLHAARFGIREPVADCPAFPLNQLDLILVPGVVWSGTGYRIGRGQGHYDRLLAAVSGVKLGVAFDWQFTDAIPVQPHDIRLNCILTPTRWLVL